MPRAAMIGAGLIGRSWAMVFARAGWEVAIHDPAPGATEQALGLVAAGLKEQAEHGLARDPEAAAKRVRSARDLADALDGAAFVQENAPETVEAKLPLFRKLDRLAAPEVILASSTSAIVASRFTAELPGRARCLVAHPVNPPHLVPIVELSGAPWTAPETIARAKAVYESIGQVPIVVRKSAAGRAAGGSVPPGRGGFRLAAGSRQDREGRPRLALVVHGSVRDHRAQCPGRHARLLCALHRVLPQPAVSARRPRGLRSVERAGDPARMERGAGSRAARCPYALARPPAGGAARPQGFAGEGMRGEYHLGRARNARESGPIYPSISVNLTRRRTWLTDRPCGSAIRSVVRDDSFVVLLAS
jgi:hypothetical protein